MGNFRWKNLSENPSEISDGKIYRKIRRKFPIEKKIRRK